MHQHSPKNPAKQETPIRSFSIAAFVCKQGPGSMEVLLLRRRPAIDLGGTWQMVAGKVEPGETAWQAALREIQEETGITPDRFYSTNRLEQFYHAAQNCINLIPIFVAFVEHTVTVRLSNEHDAFQWVPHQELHRHVAFPHQAETARYIFHHFIETTPSEYLRLPITPKNP